MKLNNMWTVMFITFFMLSVSAFANEIGLATETIPEPEAPDAPEAEGGLFGGALDGLFAAVRWSFNTVGALIQLMTFQVDIPPMVNTLVITPMIFGILYLIIIVVRGGAS